jgi:hypothetical protein
VEADGLTWHLKAEIVDLASQTHVIEPQACVVRLSGVEAGDFSLEIDDSDGSLRTWLVGLHSKVLR